MATKKEPLVEVQDEQNFGEIVGNIIANTPDEHPRVVPDKLVVGTKTVEKDGVQYVCNPVRHKSKNVGFAPTKMPQGDNYDDQLEWLTNEYGSDAIVKCFVRQNKQDAMNAVRAKYNKDKVSASAVLKAIGTGALTPEDIAAATEEMTAGKGAFTDLCAARLGIGEDALKNADPKHVHWDCAQ